MLPPDAAAASLVALSLAAAASRAATVARASSSLEDATPATHLPHAARRAVSPPRSSGAAFPTGSPRSARRWRAATPCCSSPARAGRAERTIELLKRVRRPRRPVERADDAQSTRRRARRRSASSRAASGCRTPALQIYAEADVFEEERRRGPKRRQRSATTAFLSDLRDLKVGDLVVHVDHGIGVFVGLKQIGVGDGDAGVPGAALRRRRQAVRPGRAARPGPEVQRRAREPPLDRLGGTSWERAKTQVKKAMRDMAEELLKLYAARKAVPGHAFSPDSHWQQEFEDAFEYELTVGSGDRHHRHQARHGVVDADGPPALRRRRLRQDRGGDARRLQGGDGRQAGGVSRADHRARVPAPEDAAASGSPASPSRIDMVSRFRTKAEQKRDARGPRPPARSTSSSARTGCCRRTSSSATSACWSSTRSSASASRTRSGSSRCGRRSTC